MKRPGLLHLVLAAAAGAPAMAQSAPAPAPAPPPAAAGTAAAAPSPAAAVPPSHAPWIWSGVEILGNHHVPRAAIERMIPIPIGGPYTIGDAPFWKEPCAAVERHFGFAKVECGERPLRVFQGHTAFLIVDVVERGNERFMTFRDAPQGTVAFGDERMAPLLGELNGKTQAAGIAGHGYSEGFEKGYLTYTDASGRNEDLAPLTDELARRVPPQRDNLFAILRGEQDPGRRRDAATLLNWAGGDLDDTIAAAIALLDDPDFGVRNNLSRYMSAVVTKVESKRLRHRMIDAYLFQIQRPSHGDRNKGLFALLSMAQASPESRAYIRRRGVEPIRYLAENSIIFNVKPTAEELLALLAKKD